MPSYLESPVASRELEALTAHIAENNLRAALRFVDAVRAAYDRLAQMPELGGEWPTANPRLRGIRCWPLPRFKNFVIFYRPIDQGVEILHIARGSRDLDALLGGDDG